jgi:hypothetical protein
VLAQDLYGSVQIPSADRAAANQSDYSRVCHSDSAPGFDPETSSFTRAGPGTLVLAGLSPDSNLSGTPDSLMSSALRIIPALQTTRAAGPICQPAPSYNYPQTDHASCFRSCIGEAANAGELDSRWQQCACAAAYLRREVLL